MEESYLTDLEKAGSLRSIHLTDAEMDIFLEYLYNLKKTHNYDVLRNVFDEQFLMFLDMFSGETLKIPKREELIKIASYIRIYRYLEVRGFTEDSVSNASRLFGRRRNSIKRIVNKVDRVLERSGPDGRPRFADEISEPDE